MTRLAERQNRSAPRRMTEIVDAAAAVFARLGYHGASTQDIADLLGIRQASLYYYFRSKEAALEAVCARGVEGYVEGARSVAESSLSNSDKLVELIRSHLRPMQDRADYVRVFLTQRQYLPAISRRRIGRHSRTYEQIFKSVLEEGIRNGEFRADLDAGHATLVMIGACNAATAWPGAVPKMNLEQSIAVLCVMLPCSIQVSK